jgi:hypothetical protein
MAPLVDAIWGEEGVFTLRNELRARQPGGRVLFGGKSFFDLISTLFRPVGAKIQVAIKLERRMRFTRRVIIATMI